MAQKGEQYSSQAESYSTHDDQYGNCIPDGSNGTPNYDGDQYAGTHDKTHPKNG